MIKRDWPWSFQIGDEKLRYRSLDLAHDESCVVARCDVGRDQSSIDVLRLPEGRLLTRIPIPTGDHDQARISPDGKLIAADGALALWRTVDGKKNEWQPPGGVGCDALAWHPTERKLLAVVFHRQGLRPFGELRRRMSLYDIDNKIEEEVAEVADGVRRICLSASGSQILYVSDRADSEERVYHMDLASRKKTLLHVVYGDSGPEPRFYGWPRIGGVAFLDENRIVVANESTLHVFEKLKLIKSIELNLVSDRITAIQAGPDGRSIYYGTERGWIRSSTIN